MEGNASDDDFRCSKANIDLDPRYYGATCVVRVIINGLKLSLYLASNGIVLCT